MSKYDPTYHSGSPVYDQHIRQQKLVTRMQEISAEMQREAKQQRPDDNRIEALAAELNQTEADLAADRARQYQQLLDRVGPDGRPSKVQRGATTRDLDSDPFGEPGSIDRHGAFGSPWEIGLDDHAWRSSPASELRSRAISAIERSVGSNQTTRSAAVEVIERFDSPSGDVARLALATSSPDYVAAFGELVRQGGLANAILSEPEVFALRRAREVARAMSLSDASGGYLVPFQLDPAVILTSDLTSNPVRKLARRVFATGDKWNGASAGAVAWSWDAEVSEVSDDAPTFAQPSVEVHKAAGWVPMSLEVAMDASNVTGEVQKLLLAGRDDLEGVAFVAGAGSGEPFGFMNVLDGVAGSIVNSATASTFGLVDVYAVDADLPTRYKNSPRAGWFGHPKVVSEIRQFSFPAESDWGAGDADTPARLLGRQIYEAESMDSTYNTDSYVLCFGDFESYVIADRATSVEFVPHVFGANQRPTGQRGLYAWHRVGGNVVNNAAFRILRVTQ